MSLAELSKESIPHLNILTLKFKPDTFSVLISYTSCSFHDGISQRIVYIIDCSQMPPLQTHFIVCDHHLFEIKNTLFKCIAFFQTGLPVLEQVAANCGWDVVCTHNTALVTNEDLPGHQLESIGVHSSVFRKTVSGKLSIPCRNLMNLQA